MSPSSCLASLVRDREFLVAASDPLTPRHRPDFMHQEREMVQVTASYSPRQTREAPMNGSLGCGCDAEHLEEGTLVEPIRVRTAPDLGLDSWGNSEHATP